MGRHLHFKQLFTILAIQFELFSPDLIPESSVKGAVNISACFVIFTLPFFETEITKDHFALFVKTVNLFTSFSIIKYSMLASWAYLCVSLDPILTERIRKKFVISSCETPYFFA